MPAFNEERLLGQSLDRVFEACKVFEARRWAFEVIVCDNNSTDRTAEIARNAGASVVFEPVNQISRARNRGAAAAGGDWLVFIDADSYPVPGLFEEMAEAMESERYLAGGSEVCMNTSRPMGLLFNGLWNRISRWGTLMAGSFIFVQTAEFRAVGGFSEQLFAGEELDLTYRLKCLARQKKLRLVILRRHPLVTSGRKIELYSAREIAGLFCRALLTRDRMLHDRQKCGFWYDGRR